MLDETRPPTSVSTDLAKSGLRDDAVQGQHGLVCRRHSLEDHCPTVSSKELPTPSKWEVRLPVLVHPRGPLLRSQHPSPLGTRCHQRPAPMRLPTEDLTPSTIQAGPGLKWFLFAADDGPRRLWRFCRLCPCPSVAVKRMSALLSLLPGWPSGLPNAVMHVVMRNGPAARRNFDKMTRN